MIVILSIYNVIDMHNLFSLVYIHIEWICSNNLSTGGVTTVVDMPLNNYPTTVSKETLKLKVLVIDPV